MIFKWWNPVLSGIFSEISNKNCWVEERLKGLCPTVGLQGNFVEEFLKTEGSLKVAELPKQLLGSHCELLSVNSAAFVLCLCLVQW